MNLNIIFFIKNFKIIIMISIFVSFLLPNKSYVHLKKEQNLYNGKNNRLIIGIETEKIIKGFQCNLNFNYQEISINESTIFSLNSNIHIFTNTKNNGLIQIMLFSLENDNINNIDNEGYSDIIEIFIEPQNQFIGISQIKLDEIKLVGKAGIPIISNIDSYIDIMYNAPKNTSFLSNSTASINVSSNINYQIAKKGFVSIVLYDSKEIKIKTLIEEYHNVGYYNTKWDGLNYNGVNAESGKYILKMIAPGYTEKISFTYLK